MPSRPVTVSLFDTKPPSNPYPAGIANLPRTRVLGPWHLCRNVGTDNDPSYVPDDATAVAAGRKLQADGVKRVVVEIEANAGPTDYWNLGNCPQDAAVAAAKRFAAVLSALRTEFRGEVGLYNFPV